MKRLFLLACLLFPPVSFPAWAGGGMMLAPPSINIQPRNPVLDQQCVDRLKGSGASTARAAHECRKAYNPGTPQPLATRAPIATDSTSSPAAKP